YAFVTGLNSDTGARRFRVPIPHVLDHAPVAGQVLVDEDDQAVVAFALAEDDGARRRIGIDLLRIDDAGMPRVAHVADLSEPGEARVGPTIVRPYGYGGKYLVFMKIKYADGRTANRVVRMAKDEREQYDLPAMGEYVLGEDSAYTADDRTLVAFDPV